MLAKKGEGFISKRIFELAITDHTPNFDEHRGFGFQLVGRRYGHTGFTGTSIFVHRDTQEYLILLTNRVHPTRERAGLYNVRKSLNSEIFGE
jgi:CubicO group peptidase (beta-lactamase class C family)